MATSKKDKNESKNLRTLFSVICLSIIALGLIVYFSSQGSGKTPVGEPTSVTETTSAAAVQHRVEGAIQTEAILFSNRFGYLGETKGAEKLAEKFKYNL